MLRVHCLVRVVLATSVAALTFAALAAEAPRSGGIQGKTESTLGTENDDKGELRRREGTSYAGEGFIQFTGERLTFVSTNGKDRLVILENLALDRVNRTVRDATYRTKWKVIGSVTEYQGANFLLLERAVLVHHNDELGP